ncbi:hypothetical protein D3C79_764450 [compost metagenome]
MPLVPVHRLAEAGQVVGVFEGAGPLQVAHQIVLADLDGAVILPLVRVADLGPELGEFGQGLGLGGRRHPVQLLDALAVGGAQVLHQLLHAGLGLGREVALHIELADRLTQQIVKHPERTLPGGALLGGTAQGGAEEGEVLAVGLAVEIGGVIGDEVPLEVGLPVADRGLLHQAVEGRQIAGLADHQAALASEAGLAKIGIPVDGGG